MKPIVLALVATLALPATTEAKEYFVRMKFNEDAGRVYFEPSRIKIKLGDTVTWIQDDQANKHDVVAYPEGIPKRTKFFRSPLLTKPGMKWSKTFTKRGTYKYHCHPHEAAGMKGVIIVERESRADEFRKARPGEHIHKASADDGGHAHGHHASQTQKMVKGTTPADGAELKEAPSKIGLFIPTSNAADGPDSCQPRRGDIPAGAG